MKLTTIPNRVREVRATEKVLTDIYNAARVGLKGDSLALAAGLRPEEYRALVQLDPDVQLQVAKAKADAEMTHAYQLEKASLEGDVKATLAILQHVHGWESKAAAQSFGAGGITINIGEVKSPYQGVTVEHE